MGALRAHGHEIILVGPPGLLDTSFGGSSRLIDLIKRCAPSVTYEIGELAYNLRAFLRLRAAVRRHRPDLIYERFSLFLFAGLWVRRVSGIPLLLEVNSPLCEERTANDGLRLRALGRRAQRALWRGADHVLPVTAVLARTVADNGISPSRITVIPNGIDAARFGAVPATAEAKVALGIPPRLVLGFTGFVRGWNAVHRLIDVAADHRQHDLHVLVVGDGPARASLEAHARERGIPDRLTITGIVGRDDVARHVAAFDIAVLPGVTPYSSPLKLFEYLRLGRAIVAPDGENIREILTDGHDALLFDPATPDSMEASLLRLCTDLGLRERLSRNAPRTIESRQLTWGHNAQRVIEIASSLSPR